MRNIVLILVILTALVLAWRIEGRRGPFFSRVLLLLGLALGVEVVGTVTSRMSLPNALLYNLYAALEFALLMDMVRVLRPRWQPGLVVVSLTGLVSLGCAALMIGPTHQLAVEGLLVIGVLSSGVFLCLLVDLSRTAETAMWRIPVIWFFTGALLYFGGIIPVLGSWHTMTVLDARLADTLYGIVVGLAVVRYGLAGVACALEQHRRVRSWTRAS